LNLPTDCNVAVVCTIEAGDVPSGEYTVILELRNPSGEVRTRTSLALVVEKSGDVLRIPAYIGLHAPFDEYGVWRLTARSESADLASLDFLVKRTGERTP